MPTQFPIPLFRALADSHNSTSYANRLRSRRFNLFASLVAELPRPISVLDVGGTNEFWEQRGWAGHDDVRITTLNLEFEEQRNDNIKPLTGDATDLRRFEDQSFDVVFSNSVIEHLFTWENQMRMATEVRRVGRGYYVQTPNFWFPMEPHFHVPGWQWIPSAARVAILRRRRCGWRGPSPDKARAKRLVEEVQLLKRSELRELFPDATLVPERLCGFVKSWMAVRSPDRG